MKSVLCIFLLLLFTTFVFAADYFSAKQDIFLSTAGPGCENCDDSKNENPANENADESISWSANIKGPKGELPVFPGGKGFGIYNRPAKNATVYKVTNLNASGFGSLRYCVEQIGPRVCVFEVSGRITHNSDLKIRNSNIHIAGQTAPYPGITIQSTRNVISASNVVIEHLRFMSNDKHTNSNLNDATGYHNRDALAIETSSRISNIALNHVSINFGIDGNLDIWGIVDNVTVRNSIIAQMLEFSIHVDENGNGWDNLASHSTSILIGHEVGNIDFTRSVIAYAGDRLPRSGANNLFYSENINYLTARNLFLDIYTRNGYGNNTKASANVVGNVFITKRNEQKVVQVAGQSNGEVEIYYNQNQLLLGNGNQVTTPSPWQAIRRHSGNYKLRNSPATMPHAQTIPNKPVNESQVLDFAGARPTQRIGLETEIMANIKSRKGDMVNCYSEEGDPRFDKVLKEIASYPESYAPSIAERCELDDKGWTGWRYWLLDTKVMNRRSLDSLMPSSSERNTVLPSGYTKLEAFLHACSRKVELNYGECSKNNIDTQGRGWR